MIFGRPETFAVEVSALGIGPSGNEPISAKTWAATKLIVSNRNLFRNLKRDGGTVSESMSETGLTEERLARVRELTNVETNDELFQLPRDWFQRGTLADVRVSPIAVAFRCVAPVVDASDLAKIRTAFLGSHRDETSFKKLEELANAIPSPMQSRHDFVRGYRLARGLRSRLKNTANNLDINALISELGIRVSQIELSDSAIDGGCICDTNHGPAIFVNPNSTRAATSWGRRVVLAHELCHLLFDREHARPIGVLSGPWAPPRIERVANAFAVELLLPLAGIIASVGPVWHNPTDEDIKTLMDKYGLGLTAVGEHLRNMRRLMNRE